MESSFIGNEIFDSSHILEDKEFVSVAFFSSSVRGNLIWSWRNLLIPSKSIEFLITCIHHYRSVVWVNKLDYEEHRGNFDHSPFRRSTQLRILSNVYYSVPEQDNCFWWTMGAFNGSYEIDILTNMLFPSKNLFASMIKAQFSEVTTNVEINSWYFLANLKSDDNWMKNQMSRLETRGNCRSEFVAYICILVALKDLSSFRSSLKAYIETSDYKHLQKRPNPNPSS